MNRMGRFPQLGISLNILRVRGLASRVFTPSFQGGVQEVCRLAGVPAPTDRMGRTAKAVKAVKAKKSAEAKKSVTEEPSMRLVLSEEQTRRLLGISHLERGKDPLVIIDEILDNDSKLRKYGLSLSKVRLVLEYLENAIERGWNVPWLIEVQTRLQNAGVMKLKPRDVAAIASFLECMVKRGWRPEHIPIFLITLWNLGVPELTPKDLKVLVELLRAAKGKGLSPEQLVNACRRNEAEIERRLAEIDKEVDACILDGYELCIKDFERIFVSYIKENVRREERLYYLELARYIRDLLRLEKIKIEDKLRNRA